MRVRTRTLRKMIQKNNRYRVSLNLTLDPITHSILDDTNKRTGKSKSKLIDHAVKSVFMTVESKILMIRKEKQELGIRLTTLSKEEERLFKILKESLSEPAFIQVNKELEVRITKMIDQV